MWRGVGRCGEMWAGMGWRKKVPHPDSGSLRRSAAMDSRTILSTSSLKESLYAVSRASSAATYSRDGTCHGSVPCLPCCRLAGSNLLSAPRGGPLRASHPEQAAAAFPTPSSGLAPPPAGKESYVPYLQSAESGAVSVPWVAKEACFARDTPRLPASALASASSSTDAAGVGPHPGAHPGAAAAARLAEARRRAEAVRREGAVSGR